MRLRFTRSLTAAAVLLALHSSVFAADVTGDIAGNAASTPANTTTGTKTGIASYAPESVSVELGTGNKTQMLRVGAQWDWGKTWFKSNGTHLNGYWDASIATWRENKYQQVEGASRRLTDVGFTPVLRFERDDRLGFYAEGGIGVNRLSSGYDNDGRRLSTLFQFGDHIGAGYVFSNHWDIGMKLQHFSNGGYRKPNSGVNWIEAKAAYRF
jgi:lipid A 3-O-deacylase